MRVKFLFSFYVCLGAMLFFSASIVYGQGSEELISALGELRKSSPDKAAQIYEMIADNFAQEKDFAQALSFYKQAQELNPGNEVILSKLANLYHYQERINDEITIYRELVSLYPHNPFYYERLSNLLAQVGKDKEIEEIWDSLINNNPYSVEAYRRAALYFCGKKNYSEAIDHIQKAIQLQPDEVNLRFQHASILFQAGKADDAADLYNEIINSDSDLQIKENAINKLVILKKQTKELPSFIAQLEPGLDKEPIDISLHSLLARAYFIDGRQDEAAAIYKKITQNQPSQRANYNQLIEIYNNQGNLQDLSQLLKSMINIWPKDLSLYHRLAQAYLKDDCSDLAIKTYEDALKVSANNPSLLFSLAGILIKEGRFTEAQKKLDICVSLEPENKDYRQKLEFVKKNTEKKAETARVKKERRIKKAPGERKPWWKRLFGW